jgi:hypothetical protein
MSAGPSSPSRSRQAERRRVRASPRNLLFGLSLVAGGLVAAITAAGPALADGQVCAGIVIDDGSSGTAVTHGATVTPGSSDLDLLHTAGDVVTQNNAGLVCAIDGYPPNGLQNCLSSKHGLYYYWSYWEGDPATDTWTYASIGPAEHTVSAGQSYVEGWRYQDPGPDSPAAPKPSVSPSTAFAKACQSSNPVPTTTAGPPTTGHGRGGRGASRGGEAPPVAAEPSAPGSTAPTHTRGGSDTAPTTGEPRSGTVPTAAHDVPTSTTSTTAPVLQPKPKHGAARFALSGQVKRADSGSNPVLPIVLVVVAIGALCVFAWFRWRRRPTEG